MELTEFPSYYGLVIATFFDKILDKKQNSCYYDKFAKYL